MDLQIILPELDGCYSDMSDITNVRITNNTNQRLLETIEAAEIMLLDNVRLLASRATWDSLKTKVEWYTTDPNIGQWNNRTVASHPNMSNGLIHIFSADYADAYGIAN